MNRNNIHQPDYFLWGTVICLILFGLVMLASASSVLGFERFDDSNFFLKRQLVSLGIGLVAMLVIYRIDYHRWQAWAVPFLFATVILLLAVFIPGLGVTSLGAHRWVNFGLFIVQPSEIAKLAAVIYFSVWLDRRAHRIGDLRSTVLPYIGMLGLLGGLILAEPDLGTTTIILGTAVLLFITAGGPWRHVIGFLGVAAVGFLALIRLAPYRAQRFTVFLNPDLDPLGIGYHINQALLAIGSGGLFGLGLGHSRQKFNYLPEPAGDSIFAVMAEELGFVFITIFILAWLMLILRGMAVARQAPDRFGRLVAIGVTGWLGLQAFLNIGALSAVLPLTGIPLPFLSHGGSAIITSLAAVGILLNISRQTSRGGRHT